MARPQSFKTFSQIQLGLCGKMLLGSPSLREFGATKRFAFSPLPRQQQTAQAQPSRIQISLLQFAMGMYPQYQQAEHHQLIAQHLEAVERGELKRLAIFMPPRHGKSLLCSRMFPAWYLGRHPDRQIIAASYNSELATDFGRQVRNVVASEEYQALFPGITLSADSKAAARWHTSHGGQYVAAGVGTAITGRGAHVALIDDPHKDRQEADSQTYRDRAWDWYTSTLYTRLMPGGAIVLIQTRWHEDDLAGKLLREQETRDKWTVLDLPAINDAGDALWPEWFPLDRLQQIRAAIGTRDWEALYQQRPAPSGGGVLKREWFRIIPMSQFPPRYDSVIQIWDTAFKETTSADYSVCLTMGVAKGNFYVQHVLRDRLEWPRLLQVARQQFLARRPRLVLIEAKASGISLQQALAGETAIPVKPIEAESSKLARTTSISGLVEAGRVYLPDGADWVSPFLDECATFPVGAHDDQVDALTHGLRYFMLAQQRPGRPVSFTRIDDQLYGEAVL